MLNCKYILFIVINDVKKSKSVKKKLADLGISRYTVIDTFGLSAIEGCNAKISSKMFNYMNNPDNKKYNKTIFVALPTEEAAISVMDEIEIILDLNSDKTGKGIMFTVPIYKSHGIRI
ncbi:P-II family nitrogen regulator [Vallitalea guaymasensis]|uniref:Nitrogen regulatory protein P-II n=1 Tax=Vallitalea guaymasensis TaxID=1185412 RepID=A0A8J8M8Y2_9FIRM|nr:hypothetical protein [Vallitalea guaymasensis]QUH28393.1 hypothetical protein HYG85_05445 [Vallitalea guaymasensis]